LAATSVRFSFFAPEFSTLILLVGAGLYLSFVWVLDVFLLLGATNSAILWGISALWVTKKAFYGACSDTLLKNKRKKLRLKTTIFANVQKPQPLLPTLSRLNFSLVASYNF